MSISIRGSPGGAAGTSAVAAAAGGRGVGVGGGGGREDRGGAGRGARRLWRERTKAAPAFPAGKGFGEHRIPPAGIVQRIADGQLQLRGRRGGQGGMALSGPTGPADD